MNLDNYNEVINGIDTYEQISKDLLNKGSCIIGWTDEKVDHRDILFTYMPIKHGYLQRGLQFCYLYVSIISFNSMGFLIEQDRDNRKHESYIKEKLNLHDNNCDNKICELINGVIYFIDKGEENG